MSDIVQSAGGIIYYLAPDGEPRYLLIKRHALSGKVERVAPKGKIQKGETEKDAAIREMREETGIKKQDLVVKQLLGTTSLRSTETKKGHLDKDVSYFLMKYTGNPDSIQLIEGEGYIGVYKRATIQEVINLIYYEDIRELVRKSYFFIKEEQKNWSVKKDFLNKLT
jgi:8-oxo-dGTP pyrophosphatase MutT (NUDIX family)